MLDGQGKALVMAVGEHSELGKIAGLSGRPDTEPTPLQKEMNDLAGTLAVVAIVVSLLIPLAGFLRGFELRQMILTWLSLTFLMVPGQPPIIIAMALALASLELARQGVIVRRLQGAETLGSVTTILSDKTGTMTENRMRLGSVLFPDGQLVQVAQQTSLSPCASSCAGDLQAIPEDARDPTDLAVINAAREMADVRPCRPGPVDRPDRFRPQSHLSQPGVPAELPSSPVRGRCARVPDRPCRPVPFGRRGARMVIGNAGAGQEVAYRNWRRRASA